MSLSKEKAALRLMKPALLAAAMGCASSAWAVESGQIVAGNGTISTAGANTTISQSSDRMIVNWKNFDVASGQSVNVQQPNAKSAILNRVTGSSSATQINGKLTANGRVFVVNPNGVMFGSGAQVNVDSLVASTLDVRDSDFMASANPVYGQRIELTGKTGQGNVTNQGTINAASGVVLAGTQASNTGKINADSVSMGAGEHMQLVMDNDGVNVLVDKAAANALVQNSGAIVTKGGNVQLTAAATGDALRTVVRNSGTIEANSASYGQGGSIELGAVGGSIAADNQLTADRDVNVHAYGASMQGAQPNVSVGAPVVARQGAVTLAAGGDLDAKGSVAGSYRVDVRGSNVTLRSGVSADGDITVSGGTVTQGANVTSRYGSVTMGAERIAQANGVTTSAGQRVSIQAQEASKWDGSIAHAKASTIANVKGDSIDITGDNLQLNGKLEANGDIIVQGSQVLDGSCSNDGYGCMSQPRITAIAQNGAINSTMGNVTLMADNIAQANTAVTTAAHNVGVFGGQGDVAVSTITAGDRIDVVGKTLAVSGKLSAPIVNTTLWTPPSGGQPQPQPDPQPQPEPPSNPTNTPGQVPDTGPVPGQAYVTPDGYTFMIDQQGMMLYLQKDGRWTGDFPLYYRG